MNMSILNNQKGYHLMFEPFDLNFRNGCETPSIYSWQFADKYQNSTIIPHSVAYLSE